MLDVWMAFLKDPLNNEIQDVNEVRQALDTLKEVSEDEEARDIYYLRQQTEFGYISEKNVAVEKAHKSGKEEGKMEGASEKAIEIAKKMLAKGMDMSDISELSGLTIDEINKLN